MPFYFLRATFLFSFVVLLSVKQPSNQEVGIAVTVAQKKEKENKQEHCRCWYCGCSCRVHYKRYLRTNIICPTSLSKTFQSFLLASSSSLVQIQSPHVLSFMSASLRSIRFLNNLMSPLPQVAIRAWHASSRYVKNVPEHTKHCYDKSHASFISSPPKPHGQFTDHS